MRTWFKTIVNKFAISHHTALILGVHVLRSYSKLICEYELHSLPNKKVTGAKDHGKNYIKVRPLLVRHLLRNRLLETILGDPEKDSSLTKNQTKDFRSITKCI